MEAWVKWQFVNQYMQERHDVSVDEARRLYWQAMDDTDYIVFAQFGAKTEQGNIVLGEFRRDY